MSLNGKNVVEFIQKANIHTWTEMDDALITEEMLLHLLIKLMVLTLIQSKEAMSTSSKFELINFY